MDPVTKEEGSDTRVDGQGRVRDTKTGQFVAQSDRTEETEDKGPGAHGGGQRKDPTDDDAVASAAEAAKQEDAEAFKNAMAATAEAEAAAEAAKLRQAAEMTEAVMSPTLEQVTEQVAAAMAEQVAAMQLEHEARIKQLEARARDAELQLALAAGNAFGGGGDAGMAAVKAERPPDAVEYDSELEKMAIEAKFRDKLDLPAVPEAAIGKQTSKFKKLEDVETYKSTVGRLIAAAEASEALESLDAQVHWVLTTAVRLMVSNDMFMELPGAREMADFVLSGTRGNPWPVLACEVVRDEPAVAVALEAMEAKGRVAFEVLCALTEHVEEAQHYADGFDPAACCWEGDGRGVGVKVDSRAVEFIAHCQYLALSDLETTDAEFERTWSAAGPNTLFMGHETGAAWWASQTTFETKWNRVRKALGKPEVDVMDKVNSSLPLAMANDQVKSTFVFKHANVPIELYLKGSDREGVDKGRAAFKKLLNDADARGKGSTYVKKATAGLTGTGGSGASQAQRVAAAQATLEASGVTFTAQQTKVIQGPSGGGGADGEGLATGIKCWTCGGPHPKKMCPLKGQKRAETRTCRNCGKVGHLAADCPSKPAGGPHPKQAAPVPAAAAVAEPPVTLAAMKAMMDETIKASVAAAIEDRLRAHEAAAKSGKN